MKEQRHDNVDLYFGDEDTSGELRASGDLGDDIPEQVNRLAARHRMMPD